MRILYLHNKYQQQGGEDIVLRSEAELLSKEGHEVAVLLRDNDAIHGIGSKIRASLSAIYSRSAHRAVVTEIRRFRPDVVHVHNFFPLLSPSVYAACRAAGVPVVQTLHNFRLICPNAFLLRGGEICEKCVGKSIAWPAVVHACYRSSRLGSAAVATMLTSHRMLGTWTRDVDAYIALTEFARSKMIEGGLPAAKIHVKPNFVSPDPGPVEPSGEYFVYAGRLSEEKGLPTLLAAWEQLGKASELRIIGEGPMRAALETQAQRLPTVKIVGAVDRAKIFAIFRRAKALIVPSRWFEMLPMVIPEAFACGLPVIASDLGSLRELVTSGRTGLLFHPGDARDLARKVAWAIEHPNEMAAMRRMARAEFESRYTAQCNRKALLSIYEDVLGVAPTPGLARQEIPQHAN